MLTQKLDIWFIFVLTGQNMHNKMQDLAFDIF